MCFSETYVDRWRYCESCEENDNNICRELKLPTSGKIPYLRGCYGLRVDSGGSLCSRKVALPLNGDKGEPPRKIVGFPLENEGC